MKMMNRLLIVLGAVLLFACEPIEIQPDAELKSAETEQDSSTVTFEIDIPV